MKKVSGYVHGQKRFTSKGVFLFEAQNAVPPPPPHTVYVYIYTDTVYLFTQGMGESLSLIDICRKVPLQVNCFRWRHFVLVSIWLRSPWMDHIVLLQDLYFDTSSFFLANLPDWCSLHR
jgi:hypothetical protein